MAHLVAGQYQREEACREGRDMVQRVAFLTHKERGAGRSTVLPPHPAKHSWWLGQTSRPSSHTSSTRSPRARKALARAAKQGPVTQGYLANATTERISILFMNLAFAALDAAVPQLHTEVFCTSWFQLLMSRTLVESGQHLSTRPSSPKASSPGYYAAILTM